MGRFIAAFAAGGVLGATVGFALAPLAAPAPMSEPTVELVDETMIPKISPAPAEPIPPKCEECPPPPAVQPTTCLPSPESAQELERLRARLVELEASIHAYESDPQMASIKSMIDEKREVQRAVAPVPPPADLDPKFSEGPLMSAVSHGLRELGFDDAQVMGVDCTEYPCIVYGEGLAGSDELKRLKESSAFADYAKSSSYSFSDSRTNNGVRVEHFGLAVYPNSESKERRKLLSRRLQHRVDDMKKANWELRR